jgi:hypothetical protein
MNQKEKIVVYTLGLLFLLVCLGRNNQSDKRRCNSSLLGHLPFLLNKTGEVDNLRVTVRIRVVLDFVWVADMVVKAAHLE